MLDRFIETARYLDSMPPLDSIVVLLMAAPIIIFSAGIHEAAHWISGRCFGAPGKLKFFPLRGKSKLWLLCTMGISYEDDDHLSISNGRFRLMAAAGPAWDLLFGIACIQWRADLPAPALVRDAFGCAGMLIASLTLLMNVIPLPFGNDGWRFVFAGKRAANTNG